MNSRYLLPLITQMKAMTTKLRFAPSMGSWSTESCSLSWRTSQLPYYQSTVPISGDKSSAEQQPLKRRMTLPQLKTSYMMTLLEVPEWRTRVNLTTEKSNSNKCTQRARIRVPTESTHIPSIRMMVRAPGELTAGAPSQRQWEQTKDSLKRWKEVEGSKMKQVQSWS